MKKSSLSLIPAIIQDFNSGEVLMLAYMSRQSLKKSIETGTTWFYSRSRQKLWNKGETSGNIQTIREIGFDCDMDTLLIKVDQTGNACHTGNKSCFFSKINISEATFHGKIKQLKFQDAEAGGSGILQELYDVIRDRIKNGSETSYTFSLHKKGLDEILKKLGEESVEVILSSKHQSKQKVIYEVGDLLYHLLVLLAEKKILPDDIYMELRSRRK